MGGINVGSDYRQRMTRYEASAESVFVKAVKEGDLIALKKCVEDGADINQPSFFREATAVMYCANHPSRTNLLEYLLKHNPDLSLTNNQERSALAYAVYSKKVENVKCLLDADIDIVLGHKSIYRAIEAARERKCYDIEKLILESFVKKHFYNGFAKENDYTVSREEKLGISDITLTQAFNFASKEVITMGKGSLFIQPFKDIADQTRIKDAAEALKKLKGNPGNWQFYKAVKPVKPPVK